MQLVEQCLGILQVRGVEAFGEPVVDRGEKIVGLVSLAVVCPQAGEAGRGAELQRSRLFVASYVQGLLEAALGSVRLSVPPGQ